jgi:hypothetical protein
MLNIIKESKVLLDEYKVKGSFMVIPYSSDDSSEVARAYNDAALIAEMLLVRIDPGKFRDGDVENNQSLVFEALYDIMGMSVNSLECDTDERTSIGSIIDDMSTVSTESHRGPRVVFMSFRQNWEKGGELARNFFKKQLGIESVAKEIGEKALEMAKEILCNGHKVDSYDIQEELKLLDGINTELMKKSNKQYLKRCKKEESFKMGIINSLAHLLICENSPFVYLYENKICIRDRSLSGIIESAAENYQNSRVQQVLIVSEIIYDNPILNNSNIGDILVNTYREGGMTAIDVMLSTDSNTLQITTPDNFKHLNEGITWHERTAKNPSNTHYCNI